MPILDIIVLRWHSRAAIEFLRDFHRIHSKRGKDVPIAISHDHIGTISALRDPAKPSRVPLLGRDSCHSNVVTSRDMRYGVHIPVPESAFAERYPLRREPLPRIIPSLR